MKHFVECMLVASESSTMLNRTIYIYANLLSFFLAELFLGQIECKKCYLLSARELSIIWGNGDTLQYWNWISLPEESRSVSILF